MFEKSPGLSLWKPTRVIIERERKMSFLFCWGIYLPFTYIYMYIYIKYMHFFFSFDYHTILLDNLLGLPILPVRKLRPREAKWPVLTLLESGRDAVTYYFFFFRISEKVYASENRRKLVMNLRNVTISFLF